MLTDSPVYLGLIQNVLQDPENDWPRAVLADWLDEQGKAEWSRFIRKQLAGEPCQVPPSYVGKAAYDFLGRVGATSFRSVGLKGQAYLENEGRRLVWRRGFVHAVECPLKTWERLGPALVREHPVATVWLAGKLAHRNEFDAGEGLSWYGMGEDYRGNYEEDPEDIPLAIAGCYGWTGRSKEGLFQTDEEANEWLSERLLRWAREAAQC